MADEEGNIVWSGDYSGWDKLTQESRLKLDIHNPSVCRISIMMTKRGCITTSSATMIRRLGGLRSRIRLG